MSLRSFLFVPGDSEKKLAKARDVGADALIIDLEDAVMAPRKPVARDLAAQYIEAEAQAISAQIWVRINPLSSAFVLTDLNAVVRPGLRGLVVPKANGPADLLCVSHYLDILEARAGMEAGTVRLLSVATETARSVFALGEYATAGLSRLFGLTWGAEDLSTAIGASTNQGPDGEWALTYRMVRSQCLLAARAAEVEPIDTLYTNFKDPEGLARSCRTARSEGFTGRVAIHPDQVPVINAAFVPSTEEVAHAKRVIEAFAATPGAGTVSLDGFMVDIPHFTQARRVLALYEAAVPGKKVAASE
jgi:citrate lyase subunit beta / citryl-CoA lyase